MDKTYKPIRRLGRGAFGEVVLCRVLETGELVALKRIFVRSVELGTLPDNLVREVKCMQAVQHPNVVQLKDVYVEGSTLVLVQEFCVTDVAQLIKVQSSHIPERIIRGMMVQMLQGLAACHNTGIIHRDLKPSNVLMTAGGIFKLADFGLARPLAPGWDDPNARPAQYTHTVATRWYRAPELLYGAREYTTSVDIWSMGIILAELLGLSPLIPGENDIDQLGKTIKLLGSFETQWPQVTKLPDYGKICFAHAEPTPLESKLPHASPDALHMLSLMLRCNPHERPVATALLSHPFLLHEPLPASPREIAEFMEQRTKHSRAIDARCAQLISIVSH